MAEISAIDLVIDHRQLRRYKDPILWHVNGLDWDHSLSTDVYHDDETGRLFLKPAPYYQGWKDSNSGLYVKYRKADYTLTTSSKWNEFTAGGAGHYFLSSSDVNEAVTTAAVLGSANQAMAIGWFVYGDSAYAVPGDDGTRLECGWGIPGTSECYLKIYPSGMVKVYRYGTLIGERDLYSPETRRGGNTQTSSGGQGQAQPKSFQAFLLRPTLGGLLITCSQTGRSAFFKFPDIDIDAADAATTNIVSNTTFWWFVRNPSGATVNVQADVQLAKLQCAATGYAYSDVIYLTEPPGSDAVLRTTEWFPTTGITVAVSLVKADGTTPFNPVTDSAFRVKVTLTGSAANASLACVQGGWKGETRYTDASEKVRLLIADPDLEITDASIVVPDDIGGATIALTLLNPDKLDELQSASLAKTHSNRPLLVRFGEGSSNPIIDGRTNVPTWDDHWNAEAQELQMEATDQWKAFENTRWMSRWVFAGYTFKDALFMAVEVTGAFAPDDILIEDVPGFNMPAIGIQADDSMEPLAKVGDTSADLVKRFTSDYAALDRCRITPRKDAVKFIWKRVYE